MNQNTHLLEFKTKLSTMLGMRNQPESSVLLGHQVMRLDVGPYKMFYIDDNVVPVTFYHGFRLSVDDDGYLDINNVLYNDNHEHCDRYDNNRYDDDRYDDHRYENDGCDVESWGPFDPNDDIFVDETMDFTACSSSDCGMCGSCDY